ncbi:hypothetical protein HDU93_005179 [Gonapodya sp. JEL0774]|nr:hypothetical protein HDU93_005179 [Gonapodya sp. JEL0774]
MLRALFGQQLRSSEMPLSSETFLITGASRGIGLEFVKQIAIKYPDANIIAAVRNVEKSEAAVKAVAANKTGSGKLSVIQLDADDETSIKNAAVTVSNLYPEGIDILINNAGINLSTGVKDLETTAAQLTGTFTTNVVGPVLVTEAFLPHLRLKQTRKIVNISSILGSIGLTTGSPLSYNVSKAALNMGAFLAFVAVFAFNSVLTSHLELATVNIALALKPENFTVIPIHPGWVQTDMGGEKAPITPLQSILGMLKVISEITPKVTGTYYSFDGTTFPW